MGGFASVAFIGDNYLIPPCGFPLALLYYQSG
jgi:hypothetical protein